MCWGLNEGGQLGNGGRSNRSTPVAVTGLTSGVTAVSAGYAHTCAVTDSAGAKCWGPNYSGSLGDGTTIERRTPVDVVGLTSGVFAIAAGAQHTCALTTSGGVECWGENWAGQLGDGTQTERHTPHDVPGLTTGVAAIAAAVDHTCVAMAEGGVKCWGNAEDDGTIPVDVPDLTTKVTALAAGYYHNCALTEATAVMCWGNNVRGQLGDGTTKPFRQTPVYVDGLRSGVVAISAGRYHTCALTDEGGVKCWGSNEYGQLGNGSKKNLRRTPTNVDGLESSVSALAAGGEHTCAAADAGGVTCWGSNTFGQLGDGTPTYEPIDVLGFP